MKKLTPFNIDLMFAPDSVCKQFRPTTRTDIYDGISNNFHDDGLFSTLTFGRVGTEDRDTRFSYIQLNAEVIHPAIYEVLKKLKRLYIDIINGTGYAKWNPQLKDFESSDMLEGETGMAFFTRHLHHLQPDKRTSKKRNMYVDVFEKYKKECLMHNCLVIPAGMRDLYIDGSGREVQDEINDLYRKLIVTASSINSVGSKMNDSSIDVQRRNLQRTMNEIYEYLKGMLDGKKGLIQTKWGGRRIVNGTRNVISMMDNIAEKLDSPRAPTVEHVQIGLYQTIKGVSPITINGIKTKFTNDVFQHQSYPTLLIDRQTFKLKEIYLDPQQWDKWGTTEGLEKIIDGFKDDRLRNKPIVIDNHYFYLVYRDKEGFRCFRDINELPDPSMIEHCHPMTYAELFYLAKYEEYYDLIALVTRYPIDSVYSIFPARVYLKTTVDAKGAYEYDADFKTHLGFAREYPNHNQNASWVNTAVIHANYLDQLGADFDGDTVSVNFPYSNEAIEEINHRLGQRGSIINPRGQFIFSSDTNVAGRVFKAFTGDPEE